jgi:WD40 repeat protein
MGDADGHILVSEWGGLPWGWPCYFSGAQGQINAIHWSVNNNNKWVTASEDGTVQIWNLPTLLNYQASIDLAPVKTYRPGGHIRAVAWSPDEKYLLAGNEKGSVYFLPTS